MEQVPKGDKADEAKGPWTKTCSTLGCKKRAADEPRYGGRCFNCQVQRVVKRIDFSTDGEDNLD